MACYICSVVISGWRPGHDPLARHRQEYVECPVVTSQRSDLRLTGMEAKTARRNTFGKGWPHRAFLPDGSRFQASALKVRKYVTLMDVLLLLLSLIMCMFEFDYTLYMLRFYLNILFHFYVYF